MGIRSKMLFPLLAVALIMIAGGYLSLSSQFDSLKESFVSLIIVEIGRASCRERV